jgi:hypothetical protein
MIAEAGDVETEPVIQMMVIVKNARHLEQAVVTIVYLKVGDAITPLVHGRSAAGAIT